MASESESERDPELRRCRRYGCRHEARDHGHVDGHPRCWRCVGRGAWHQFRVGDQVNEEDT